MAKRKQREITCFIATSLDGYIAGPKGDIDWLFHDADYGFRAFYRSIDTVVMGRKTWDQALKFERTPFADKTVYVFSRKARAGRSGATIVSSQARAFVAKLRKVRGKGIWLVGGGDMARPFFEAKLVDRLVVSIHPVALGAGTPLFPGLARPAWWRLCDVKRFPSGLVQLSYEPRR